MSILKITKEHLLTGLDKAMVDYTIMALTQKGEKILYDVVTSSQQVTLDYTPTVLSPKKFFFPKEEVILEYTADGNVESRIDSQPTVLFGLRPCDLNGIKIMDEAFAESKGDPNYLAKREKSVIIGIDCNALCDDDAFCFRVDAQNTDKGYDILLHETESAYAVTTLTDKGKNFLSEYFSTETGNQSELDAFKKEKEAVFEKAGGPFKGLDSLPPLFQEGKDHAVWKEEGSRCLSCGSCIMVCPTCYCFDVADELALNLKTGQRLRRWDACMLHSFSEVAGGENFREGAAPRLHHRINRKFNFLIRLCGVWPLCAGLFSGHQPIHHCKRSYQNPWVMSLIERG